ncbi:unknow [Vibrio parahaemolyticus]|nr:unknow [Vibrio parahaemolyticus]
MLSASAFGKDKMMNNLILTHFTSGHFRVRTAAWHINTKLTA